MEFSPQLNIRIEISDFWKLQTVTLCMTLKTLTMPPVETEIVICRQVCTAVIWSVVLCLSLPPVLGWNRWSGETRCSFSEVLYAEYTFGLFTFPIVACLVVLTVLYCIVFAIAWKHRRQIQASLYSKRMAIPYFAIIFFYYKKTGHFVQKAGKRHRGEMVFPARKWQF